MTTWAGNSALTGSASDVPHRSTGQVRILDAAGAHEVEPVHPPASSFFNQRPALHPRSATAPGLDLHEAVLVEIQHAILPRILSV